MFSKFFKFISVVFLLAVFGFSQNSFAQLTGTKTIPGDYATISAAVTDLNTVGVGAGGVTFNVAAGYTETTTDSLVLTATGTSGNAIIFQKSGAGANPLITRTDAGTKTTGAIGAQGDAVITIQGSDYVTFDGIDVAASQSTIEYGYYLRKVSATDGCKFVTIKNAVIDMTKGTSAYVIGIYSSNNTAGSSVSSATGITVTSTGGRNENVTITGNTVQDVHAGIVLRGYNHAVSPFDFQDQNFVVGTSGAGNIIQNYAGGNASAAWGVYLIYHTSPNVSYNTFNNAGGGGANATSTLYGIFFSSSNAGGDAVFNNNNITLGQGTTSGAQPINIAPTCASATINNNIFSFGTFASTSVSYMIYCSNATNNITVNNNATSGTITKTGAGAFIGYYDFGTPTGGTATISNNNFSNIVLTGASQFEGIKQYSSTSQIEVITNNTISNITGGTSTVTGLWQGYGAVGSTVNGNTVTNISGTGSVTGITVGQSSAPLGLTVYNNTVNGLSTTGAGTVIGIQNVLGASNSIYKNQIYNLLANNAAGLVNGIQVSGGVGAYIFNNFISDLRAPITNNLDAIRGINITSTTATSTIGLYYNSIYLNATSSGAIFGTTGVYHTYSATATTAVLDMRDNVIVNVSTPNTTGLTVAFRRSAATSLVNFGSASNNNDLYAGTPDAAHLIFYDGTNADQTIDAYKTRVAPRCSAAFSENPPFLNVASTPYNLHMNTSIATQTESGGTPVSTPVAVTDDFDGNTRNATTPDVGADEFGGLLLDLTSPTIAYTPLLNTGSTSSRTLTSSITDVSGVPTAGIGLPRLFWKKNFNGTWTAVTGSFVSGSNYNFTFGSGVATNDTVFYYVVAQDGATTPNVGAFPSAGAGGFTANPPTAATPPTSPSFYFITNAPLAGSYTVGTSLFNQISGHNIYFEKVVQKVMKEVDVEVAMEKDKSNLDKTSILPTSKKQMMEVEEITWVPMENGQPFTGDLYVKKFEHPEIDFPMGADGIYSTITAAVADLNLRGVSGATTFLLTDVSYTTETLPITINVTNVSVPTSVNRVTIKPNTSITSLVQGAGASVQIFKILTSYITIDGSNSGGTDRSLTIENTSVTTPQVVVVGSIGTTPITGVIVKNCNLINGVNTSSAVVITDGTTPGNPGYFTNITIQNNTIQKAYIGLYSNAVVTAGNGTGLLITGNDLTTSGTNAIRFTGLYLQGVDGGTVSNNLIGNFESATGESDRAIWLATGTSNATIERNKINNIGYAGTSGYGGAGIVVSSGVTNANILIKNNLISHIIGDGDSYISYGGTYSPIGIYLFTATTQSGMKLYFNSINLYGNTINYSAAAASFGIFVGTGTTADIKDNIIVNNLGLLASTGYGSTGTYLQTAVSQLEASNYNDIFVNPSGTGAKNIGQIVTTGYSTLGAWQTAVSPNEANSISGDPHFISDADLHIDPLFNTVSNNGQFIASVTNDIDGQARSLSTPDIGGDEYIYTPPSVNDPTGVLATTISDTQINVAFTPNASSNNVVIVFNFDGNFTAPSGPPPAPGNAFAGGTLIANTITSPFNHTGLTGSTHYYYKLFSYNGSIYSPGVETDATTNASPIAPPYVQDFEGVTFPPTGWITYGTKTWVQTTTGGRNGTKGARVIYSPAGTANLQMPDLVLPATPPYRIKFWWKDNDISSRPVVNGTDEGDGAEVIGYDTTFFEISTNGGTTWVTLTFLSAPATQSTYSEFIQNLSAYSGQTIQIRWRDWSDGSGSAWGVGLDDITIELIPSCAEPSNLTVAGITSTSANIGWSGATTVDIDYGTPGHPAGTGTVISGVTANPNTISGLTSATPYDVFVRQSCGGGNYSVWVGPIQFTTLCDVVMAPWTEDFEHAAAFPPPCWTLAGTATTLWVNGVTSGYGTGTYSAKADFYGVSSGSRELISFAYDASGMAAQAVRFDWAYATYSGEVDEMDIYYSTDTGTSWNLLLAMPGGFLGILNPFGIVQTASFTPTAAQWSTLTLTLPSNANMVKFTAITAFGNNLYLDNVKIVEPLANDVGTTSIDVAGALPTGTIAPKATVKNFGSATNTFNVQMTITGGYSSTKTVTGLVSGASQQVTFDNWNATVGSYTVNVCTQLGTDGDPSNNCLSSDVGVYSGSWSNGATVSLPRVYGGAASYIQTTLDVTTGYLFVAGGIDSAQTNTEAELDRYNVNTNTWTSMAPMPAGRDRLTATTVGNFVYALGGYDVTSGLQVSTVYKYDIAGNSWTTVASLPVASGWGGAVGYNNNYIYYAGGYSGAYESAVYLYNVTSNTWTAATSMPGGVFGGAFAITGNKLVYVGGANATEISNAVFVGTIDGTDPSIITWTAAANYPGVEKEVQTLFNGNLADLAIGKYGKKDPGQMSVYPAGGMFRFSGATWGTDGIIVATGSSSGFPPAVPSPTYVFRPSSNTWLRQADVPIPVIGTQLGTVNDGNTWKLIVAWGDASAGFIYPTHATQIYTDNLGGGTTTFDFNLTVANGWNMVSVPGTNPAGMLVGNWWSHLTGTVYKFVPGSGYAGVTTTAPSEGYWLKNNQNETYNYTGIVVAAHNPIAATAGWNMIGGFEDVVDVNTLTTNTGNIVYPIYKFNPGAGYATATTLNPGVGYWVKVSANCQITIPDVLAKSVNGEVVEYFKEDWGKIQITDASGSHYTLYAVNGEVDLNNYELPPLPPAGNFDIRFGSGRIAEDINSSMQTIDMSGVTYPLTVSVEGMDIRLTDVTGKVISASLKSGESVTISDSRIEKLMVSGETIPTVYALEQNYPNPFNPSTVIEFSLPEDVSNVKLSVYNALGEKVAELVNSSLAAGRYSYQWNAKNVATGMYIYELRTDKFVSVKKMLLLK